MEEENIFGKKGIDTPYEREKIEYKPNLYYPEKESNVQIAPDVLNQIERSKDFKISRAIMDYQSLVAEINNLLNVIASRNQTDDFKEYLQVLQTSDIKKVFQIENQHSNYNQTGDYELYTVLYRMKESVQKRIDFLDSYYRTQITDETDINVVQEKEEESISEWLKLEVDVPELWNQLESDEEISIELQQKIDSLEATRRKLANLHISLADTAYIHRNRYMMFFNAVQKANVLVFQHQSLIDGNMEWFLKQLSQLGDFRAAKVHLILTFRNYKDQLNALKGQYLLIDDQKENFASEQQYFYQQLKLKANDTLKDWLYNQQENTGHSLDRFSEILVQSLEKTQKQYDDSLADLLNFYRTEASFYDRQMVLLQKKEEIRLFFRILEDFEDIDEPTDEWIHEYLLLNGYEA